MEELLHELEAAYQAISTIPVTNDAVDAMAVARAKLRKVYAEIKRMEEVNVNGDGCRASSNSSRGSSEDEHETN